MSANNKTVRKYAVCALFAASGAIVGILEGFLPLSFVLPIPGVRLGLANVFIMWAYALYGAPWALAVSCTRMLIVFLFTGNVTAFVLSFIGGMCAFLSLMVSMRFRERFCTMIGISALSSAFHGIGQIMGASCFVGQAVFYYLPILCAVSSLTGIFTGALMNALLHNKKLFML